MPENQGTNDESGHKELLYAYLKDAYDGEADIVFKIRDKISFIFGLILALTSGNIILMEGFSTSSSCHQSYFFWTSIFVSVSTLFTSATLTSWCLIRGFRYAYMPSPVSIKECADKLIKYKAETGQNFCIEAVLKDQIMDGYAKCAEHNRNANIQRSGFLVLAQRFLMISAIAIIPAAIVYIVTQRQTSTEPTNVNINEPVKIVLHHE